MGVREPQSATRGGGEGGAESPALEVPPGPWERGGALASPSTCGRDANTAPQGEGAVEGGLGDPACLGARACVRQRLRSDGCPVARPVQTAATGGTRVGG